MVPAAERTGPGFASNSAAAIGYAAPREVVRRDFDLHPIAGNDANEVLAHLARHVRNHFATDVELDPKLRICQGFLDPAFDFDRFFLRHDFDWPRGTDTRPILAESPSGK